MGVCLVDPVKGWRRQEAGVMPPELSEVARPLAVPSPPQSCGGTNSTGLPPPRPTASAVEVQQPNCQSLTKGAGENGVAESRASSRATVISKYLLTPALRTTFAAVGATDIAYSFKEILGLLKAYLYSKRHLFDSKDILYVNCKDDILGDVLKVDRFHYTDVRSLIARHIYQPARSSVESVGEEGENRDRVNGANSNVLRREISSNDAQHGGGSSSVPSYGGVNPNPNANGKTFSGASPWNGSPDPYLHLEVESHGLVSYPLVPGSSRQNPENSRHFSNRRLQRTASLTSVTIEIPVPAVPEGNSDSESVYSYQGYETALCHNTEYEDTDVSEETEFEEYELASDDEDGQEMEHSDDSDSVIEDVKVALLAVHAVYEDELEEDFWADNSDTDDRADIYDSDEQSTDDPELDHEKWDCLTCGIKNKPFVRYCGKCWQLRKNWLPERPKRKRRKPRPKKKLRTRTDSIQSDASATDHKESQSVRYEDSEPGNSELLGATSTTTTYSEQETSELVRSVSTATTVSLGCPSPPSYSSEQFSSQDSGICLSQDTFTESSQDIAMADSEGKPSCSRDTRARSSTVGVTCESSSKNARTPDSGGSRSAEASSRKRKSSPVEEDSKAKRIKSSHSTDCCADVSEGDADAAEAGEVFIAKYLKSKGRKHTQSISTKEWTKKFMKLLDEAMGYESGNDAAQMCLICCSRPKNATITHGRLSHQATCYQCARRLLDTGARCPVCRRKIHMVSKNIMV